MASVFSSRLEEHLDTLVVVRPPQDGDTMGEGSSREAQEFRASAYVLARCSPYLQAALAREWAQPGGSSSGQSKRVELTEDPQAVGHLLHFMHSLGSHSRLPDDPEALLRLLPTAHALGVEACVGAAAARLAAQAAKLEWEAAAEALSVMEGRQCEDRAAEAELAGLWLATLTRLKQLLGSLDEMLNNDGRRRQLCQLPLAALKELLAAEDLRVDCEETVFCAFAHWMNHAASNGLTPEERTAAAACILPHVRFAAMRATSVVNYWHAYRWFREWDPQKDVLVGALLCIGEPNSASPGPPANCHGQDGSSSATLLWRLGCPLSPPPLQYVSTIEVGGGSEGPLDGNWRYWAGAWWRTQADKFPAAQGPAAAPTVGLCLVCCLPPGAEVASQGLVGPKAVGPSVAFQLQASHYHQWDPNVRWQSAAFSSTVFKPLWQPASKAPCFRNGWNAFPFASAMPDSSAITWANFRQAGSPVVRNGKMLVRVTASLAGAGQ